MEYTEVIGSDDFDIYEDGEYNLRYSIVENCLLFELLHYIRSVNKNIKGFISDDVMVVYDEDNNQYVKVNVLVDEYDNCVPNEYEEYYFD